MLKHLLIPLLCSSCLGLTAAAQQEADKEPGLMLVGSVRNVFTGYGEGDAWVSVLNERGDTVAARCFLITYANRPRHSNEFYVQVPRRPARYRLHVECKGYKPLDYWYEVKHPGRNASLRIPDLLIQRDFSQPHPADSLKEYALREATVSATQVKMYYKGDTLVYNASAFKLPDGSMLDDLIRQLPGAELNEAGEIRINGRKLNYLLLNGKEFFSGNNRVMLDNLPYYTVQQLKVYEQATQRSQALGHDVDDKLYVMDVRLKKEYATGYMGNLQAGGGTDGRYLGRAFGLRFTDFSRLTLFAGSNNTNETRKPGMDSDWTPSSHTTGTMRHHQAGMDLLLENREQTWSEAANALVSLTRTNEESRSATETFLTGGSAYSRAQARRIRKNLETTLHNRFTLKKPFYLDLKTDLSYRHTDHRGNQAAQAFNAHPDSLSTDTLNTTADSWTGHSRNLTVGQQAEWLQHLDWGDDLELKAHATYRHAESEDFDRYRLDYPNAPAHTDYRNRYNRSRQCGYDYAARLLYRFNFLNQIKWEVGGQFSQRHDDDHIGRYRLEQIAGWDGNEAPLGTLPSTADLLRQGLDRTNSYDAAGRANLTEITTRLFTKGWKGGDLSLGYSTTYAAERLHYRGAGLDTLMRRRQWRHNASASYSYWMNERPSGWGGNFGLSYFMTQTAPEMLRLVPVRQTYNPLALTEGNPSLGRTTQHLVGMDMSLRRRKLNLNHHMGMRQYRNLTATATHYDRTTGVYTYRPENINGNRSVYVINDINFTPARHEPLNLTQHFQYDYARNVDLFFDADKEHDVRSTVRTHLIQESLRLTYQFKPLQLGASVRVAYRYATSARPDFSTVRATDLDYGLNLTWHMPWQLTLATDLKMYTRRGYGDASMNTDDLVWNAALSRAFLKGRLNVTLQGFDLLHNLSNVTYSINGQGRTETWSRSIPRYAMLHLQWKFNKNPKKRN